MFDHDYKLNNTMRNRNVSTSRKEYKEMKTKMRNVTGI